MKKTRHTTDQIIEKLRKADVALDNGPEFTGHRVRDWLERFEV